MYAPFTMSYIPGDGVVAVNIGREMLQHDGLGHILRIQCIRHPRSLLRSPMIHPIIN